MGEAELEVGVTKEPLPESVVEELNLVCLGFDVPWLRVRAESEDMAAPDEKLTLKYSTINSIKLEHVTIASYDELI